MDIGPRIGIEGEKAFRDAINALNTSFKTLGTEMAAVTSAFDKNDKSSKALTAQNGVLNKQIDTQKDKLVQLNSGLAQATEKYGAADKVTQGWQQQVNKATAELNKMDRALSENTKSIALQDSNWTKMGKSLDSIGTKMKTTGEGLSSVGKSLSMSVTLPIVGAGVAAVKLASDLAESMNKIDVAFKGSAEEVKAWSNTTLKTYGIAKGTSLDMAALFGDMGSAMGQTPAEAAKMSTSLVGLAGDLASFKNIGIDQASDALKGIFTGEGESLKSLGVIMLDTTLEAYALATGHKTAWKEMDQAEKVAVRYAYVMNATKNSQGDFANTSEGTANQMRIFGETMKELGANMGQYILPVITPLIAKLSEMAKAFGDLSPATQKTILVIAGIAAVIGPVLALVGSITTVVGGLTLAFATVSGAIAILTTGAVVATPAIAGVSAASGTLAGVFTALMGPIGIAIAAIALLVTAGVLLYKNWDAIKAKASELWASISAAWESIKVATSAAWTSVTTTISTTLDAIKTVFTTAWNAIVSVVMVIINGFVTGITNIFDSMKTGLDMIMQGLNQVFSGVWDVIRNVFLGAVLLILDLVTGNFGKLKTDTEAIFNNLKAAFGQIWEGIKLVFTGAVTAISSLLTLAWTNIKTVAINIFTNIKTSVITIFNSILDFFRNLPGTLYNLGATAFTSLKSGISSILNTLG